MSGVTLECMRGKESLGVSVPKNIDAVRWILGLPGWCGSITISERCTEVKELTLQ